MSVEVITSEEKVLASIIIRAGYKPAETSFITGPNLPQQVGFVVYHPGGVIKRHVHKELSRQIVGASEALMVRQGCLEIDVFDQQHHLLATRELHAGDFVLMVSGGHGFRILEETVLLEVKLGPYSGPEEKELF